jgi:hypothetical protein
MRSVALLILLLFPLNGRSEVAYWQQEVNYNLEVTLEKDLRTIRGTIDIEYINNSADTLDRLYLKAFPNAIQKGSYADQKLRKMNDYSFANLKSGQEGLLEITQTEDSKAKLKSLQRDNTIYSAELTEFLTPGDTLNLTLKFKTVLPSPHNLRMGLHQNTTKAVYWYPQVCVYDRKMGWVNSQYINWGETYGDFGKFDARIAVPEDQIVAASGVLVNESEVLPDSLKKLLHLSNFTKPVEEWPKFRFDSTKTKTWHYVAEKVNDFTFTCSNDYCIDSDTTNGVEVVAYALRKKAKGWSMAVELGKQSIATFSEVMYPYQWPVIRICDAFSGMEYPMLTNCGGEGPSPRFAYLLYHEIGHQWFMGQVGSNQADRPFLDEGFTTHIEHIAVEKYLGRENNFNVYNNWYQKMAEPPIEDRDERGFRPLLLTMKKGYDKPMIFSYDQGEEYFPYRYSAYYKSAAMHYSLRSILGDSAYFKAMHHYCSKWFFKHPYEEDFVQAMEEATGLELDHYLQQWFHSRHRLDYAFAGKKSSRNGDSYEHSIRLKRPGLFVAPIDMAVIWEMGDTSFYTVSPEGMRYQKPNYSLLPDWEQFRRLNDKYECTISSPNKIKKVVIDPYNLLLDIDRTNNQSGFWWPTEVRLDYMKYDRTPVWQYALRIRPDFWFDDPNGVQLGFHAHGSYLEIEKKFSLDARIGTKSELPAIDLELSTPFKPLGNNSMLSYRVLRADKRTFLAGNVEKKSKTFFSRPDFDLFRLELNYLNVDGSQRYIFSPFPSEAMKYLPDLTWEAASTGIANIKLGCFRTFRYGSYSLYSSSTGGGNLEKVTNRGFLESIQRAKLFVQPGSQLSFTFQCHWLGTVGEPPSQFVNHLSRVNSATRFEDSKVFRSPGTFPTNWEDDFYLFNGIVRGYQNRIIYLTQSFGGSVELGLSKLPTEMAFKKIPAIGNFLSTMNVLFFADGAFIDMQNKERYYPLPIRASETRIDPGEKIWYASSGISLSFPPVWSQHKVRLDFPFYLNKPATGDNKIEFRFSAAWILPAEF